jgi:hypothetical protein
VSIEPRDVAHLSGSLNRRLGQYALAASSAGVGRLALAQSAEAKIVYTKTHQVIGANGVYNLDLNHDGIVDFVIQQIDYCNSTSCFGFQRYFLAKEALGNAVQGRIGMSNRHYAGALRANAWIGARQRFISRGHNGETMLFVWEDQDFRTLYTFGKWNNVKKSLSGAEIRNWGKDSLRLGAPQCSQSRRHDHWDANWLRLRDNPQQIDGCGQNQRVGYCHGSTCQPRTSRARCCTAQPASSGGSGEPSKAHPG